MMYYDITTPDTAYDWIYNTLQIKKGHFIEDYLIKCNKDIDLFCEMYEEQIDKINLDELEIIAFQVTSCKDDCKSIRNCGIRNLQWVLSNDTEMRELLLRNEIHFNIEQKKMFISGQEYDVDYEKYRGKLNTQIDKKVEPIAHKIYYDYQINAFFFCKDISKYSTVCDSPEILYTLAQFSSNAKVVEDMWIKKRKAYVIKYKAKLKDFAHFTFYDNEIAYYEDRRENYKYIKQRLISLAIDGMNGELPDDVFAYMKPNVYISPEDILEIVSAEEWRINVLKYFGEA